MTRAATPAASLLLLSLLAGSTGCDSMEPADVLFSDDFEAADCLGQWTVGGRQREGTNVADCEVRGGDTVGHLFKFSFTEITLDPAAGPFPYADDLTFRFDLEVRTSSGGGAPDDYYGMAGVRFSFYDSGGERLGHVSYLAATTNYPFATADDDPAVAAVRIAEGTVQTYEFRAADLLARIGSEPVDVATIGLSFRTYSSTRPRPHVEAELWVDDVQIERPR